MADFDEFLDVLKKNIEELAEKSWKDYRQAAIDDGEEFLNQCKEDLRRWTKLLAEGQLTQDDFEWLIQSQKDLAEVKALTQAGLTLIRLDRFRNALIDLVIETAFDVFL